MTESAFLSYVIGSMMVAFIVGYQWGKYARILKELSRAA
jgi:hypothetical protein